MIMDSGSLQSSSGGDEEEYDSRAADSLFLTTHPPPPPLFDPLSNYMHPLLFNQPISWPGTASIMPDPNPSNTINPAPSFQTPPVGEDNRHVPVAPAAARNTKKRSRASRRAPTTVLTTDTANFRAMVQEFTGIPAQPFDNSSFKRSRLDLFGGSRSSAPPPPPFLVSSASFSTSTDIAPNPNLNLFNVVQNPLLTSLLQSNPKFMFSNSAFMASKPQNQSQFEMPSNEMKMGGLDPTDGSRHISAALSGLPNLISPDAESWKKDGDGEKHYSSADKEGMVESWVTSSE